MVPAWQGLVRLAGRGAVLACADQGVVSGTSFVTLIMMAWWTDAEQLGTFALGLSVLALFLAVQHSFVALPYSIQRHRPPEEAAEHAFCCLVHGGLVSALGVAVLAAAAVGLSAFAAGEDWAGIAWALAAVTPFVLAKEFARDFALARLAWRRAVILDATWASIQLSLIVWLGLSGRLSPVTAYAALGLSCGLAALGWLWLSRAAFVFRFARLPTVLRQNWQLGRWLFLSRLAILVQGYSTHWLTMLIAGAAVTGIYAACVSIVSFANPLLMGLYRFLMPNSVLAWKDGGIGGLRRRALGDTLLLGAALGSFFILVLFAGEDVMRLLYPGEAFRGHGLTVAVLALGTLVAALGLPAANCLAAMERPRPVAATGGLAALVNVVLVWWLLHEWGLVGAAWAVVAANLVATTGRWVVFLTLTPSPEPEAEGGASACASVAPSH